MDYGLDREWLQSRRTTGRTQRRYRLLVLDGHSSHLSPRFYQICRRRAIYRNAVLEKENHGLRAANEKKKQKRERSKAAAILYRGVLDPASSRIASNSIAIQSEKFISGRAARAPPRRTNCGSIGHNRLQCPDRASI